MSIITLTSDFGAADWFVGAMKGVILGIAPTAVIVDISHGIASGDVRAGAFALAASCRFFPRRAIHVAIVDPGVGSRRGAIAVHTADYVFVGPDNGVLSLALRGEAIKSIHRLENQRLFLKPVSRTFHGRDIFAPVAAHLSQGTPCEELGPARRDFQKLDWPRPGKHQGGWRGEVVFIDHFGNAITNIRNEWLDLPEASISFRGKTLCPLGPFYQSVAAGRPLAVPGSSGFLEIAINGGSAAQKLGLQVGSAIAVSPGRTRRTKRKRDRA